MIRLARAVLAILAAIAVLAISLTAAPSATAEGGSSARPTAKIADRDCSDFATQKAAQVFFLDHGGPQSDPHQLDADGDGIACESNPCPCYYGTSSGGGGGDHHAMPTKKTIRQHGKITKVVDGDTVKVRLKSGKRATVRLLGIDTPEVYGGAECWGRQASKAAKRKLPIGTRVTLISDPTQQYKDRYGRLLRYVLKGQTDISRWQLRRGNATVYVYAHKPFKRVKSYKAVQAGARSNDRGMWGHC